MKNKFKQLKAWFEPKIQWMNKKLAPITHPLSKCGKHNDNKKFH